MKRKLLITLGAGVAVVVLLAALIPVLFNAERFRPTIEQRLEAALGRRVQIAKLTLSVLAGGIRADEVSIADDPVFSQSAFLRARSIELQAEWWPLIASRTLHVTGLTVREPQLVLVQSPRGTWNFESIGRSEPKNGAGGGSPGPGVSVERVRLEKGVIVIRRPAGTQTYSDLSLDARDVSYSTSFDFTLKATTPGNGKLQIEGKAGPVPTADPSQVPLQATVQIDGLDLGNSGYFGRPSPVDGVTKLQGHVSSDGRLIRADAKSETKSLRLVNGGTATRDPVALELETEYNLNTQAGRITRGEVRPRANGKSGVRLGGSYDARANPAALRLEINAQNVPTADIANLLPALALTLPGGASLQGGTMSASMAVNGPVDRLVISGPLRASDVHITGFDLGAKLSGIGTLAGIKTGPDTTVEHLNTRLQVTPETTRFDNIDAAIAGVGTLTGFGTVAANHALDFHLLTKLAGQGGLLGGLLKGSGVGQLSNVAFAIQGTTTNPQFVPDVNSILTQKPAAQSTDQQQQQQTPLGGFLGNIFKRK